MLSYILKQNPILFYVRGRKFNDTLLPIVSQPGFFNITSTFRRDSDFPIPYFGRKIRSEPCISCLSNPTVISKKTRLMTWFVSHCKTQSKREEYMAELFKYIPVDVYGDCGNITDCNKDKRGKGCSRRLLDKYKFYFSAENAICKEYFTGKKDTIPISDVRTCTKYWTFFQIGEILLC